MKKILFFGLLCLLVTSVLFAGGEKEKAVADDIGFNETGYPIVDTPITLKIITRRRGSLETFDKLPMFQELEKKTNIHIEWVTLDSDYFEKQNLMMASGELPDMFFGTGMNDFDIMGNIHNIVPMNDLIDKYAPNLKKLMDEDDELTKVATFPDGNIYSFPQRMPHVPAVEVQLAINKEWLDKLGLDVPTTTDEYYNVLKAFKEQDPNGNGIADEIPLCSSDWNRFDWVYGSFGIPRRRMFDLAVNDGVVEFIPMLDRYKEIVKYLHQMYSEGLIDQEAFTTNQSQWRQKLRNPDIRIAGSAIVFTIESMFGPGSEGEYVSLPPLKGPFGDQYPSDDTVARYGRNAGIITTSNKYPEATMRWLDELYDQEMAVQLMYGSLGDRLEKTADGRYKILPPSDPEMSYDVAKWMYAPANRGPIALNAEWEAKIIPSPTTEIKMAMVEQNMPYYEAGHAFPKVFFTKEVADELAILNADLIGGGGNLGYTDEMLAKWVVNGGVEEEWDDYIVQLKKMNVDRLVKLNQEAYNNYMK